MSDDKRPQSPDQDKASPKGDEQTKPLEPPKLGEEQRGGKGPWKTKGEN